MAGKRFVLVATGKPWSVQRGALELGDALYPRDPGVEVIVDEEYPVVYVFSGRLDAVHAFRLVVAEPPAYLERVVPVMALVSDVEAVLGAAVALGLAGAGRVWVEVHSRGFHLPRGREGERRVQRLLLERLAGSGVRVGRGDRLVVVEDTRYGLAVAVLGWGEDRLRVWRMRRLGGVGKPNRVI